MMEQDCEKDFYLMLNKVQKEFGDTDIIRKFSQNIVKYFLKEYKNDDYDVDNINDDLIGITEMMINKKQYKRLNKILSDDDIVLVIATIANQMEEYIKLTRY